MQATAKLPIPKPLALLAVFLLPVVIAWGIARLGWYQTGVTAQGQLLKPPLAVPAWQQALPQGQWAIVAPCHELSCQAESQLLQQMLLSLGRKQAQVSGLLLSPQPIHSDSALLYFHSPSPQLPQPLQQQDHWYLMDPLGLVMLSYPAPTQQTQKHQASAMLKDLRKLLKLSRIS